MRQPAQNQWDAIVVGSGLGGLSCAAYLCAAGKRTLVLEAHYVAGGNSQIFRRNRKGREYEFDVGIHYIGECAPDGLIPAILRGAGLAERVAFRQLDGDGFDTLVFPDFTFRVPKGWDRYRSRLLETFPEEAGSIGTVVDILRRVADEGARVTDGDVAMQEMASEAPTFAEWGLRPVPDLFREHGLSERASAVLLAESLAYACPPSRTPVALQGWLLNHYVGGGAYYPEGGAQMIAGRLVEAIRAYGGEVRTEARVERIHIEKGRAAGVTLENGERIDAPSVVSNADLKRTMLELVEPGHLAADTLGRVRGYRMALPLFVVYLGLDIDVVNEGIENTNYHVWGTYDVEQVYRRLQAGEMPKESMAYATFTSVKDPTNPRLAPEGYTNLQIMTVAPPDYAYWKMDGKTPSQGARYRRDPAYRSHKKQLTEQLIDSVERVLPAIRDHIDWKEAATPITQERFTRSCGGTSYGIELACDQIGSMRMGPETEVPGLFLSGASGPSGHGIANAMRSGVLAAGAALDTDLLPMIRSGEVIGDSSKLPELRDDWDAWQECH